MAQKDLIATLRWILFLPALSTIKNCLQLLAYSTSSRLGLEDPIFDFFYGALITIGASLIIYWLSPRYKWISSMSACLILFVTIGIDYGVFRFALGTLECDGRALEAITARTGQEVPFINYMMSEFYPIYCNRMAAYAGGVIVGTTTMFFHKRP